MSYCNINHLSVSALILLLETVYLAATVFQLQL